MTKILITLLLLPLFGTGQKYYDTTHINKNGVKWDIIFELDSSDLPKYKIDTTYIMEHIPDVEDTFYDHFYNYMKDINDEFMCYDEEQLNVFVKPKKQGHDNKTNTCTDFWLSGRQ